MRWENIVIKGAKLLEGSLTDFKWSNDVNMDSKNIFFCSVDNICLNNMKRNKFNPVRVKIKCIKGFQSIL